MCKTQAPEYLRRRTAILDALMRVSQEVVSKYYTYGYVSYKQVDQLEALINSYGYLVIEETTGIPY